MANNRHYWIDKENRAKKAIAWTDKMNTEHADEIRHSIQKTRTYDDHNGKKRVFTCDSTMYAPELHLIAEDSVTAIINAKTDNPDCKTAVLNFASYKHPGGMFVKGSRAQEECLCHESFLYNVLKTFENSYYVPNRKRVNRSLYNNQALYSPDIHFYHDDKDATCDVITCAAPNFSSAEKYSNVEQDENDKVLRLRIRFVLDIAAANNVDTLILGAFGCGVFGQNPYTVANIMKTLLCEYPFKEVIFAIPNSKDANYKAFQKVITGK